MKELPGETVRIKIPKLDFEGWLLEDFITNNKSRAIAPLEHCDSNGELIMNLAFIGTSFAHYYQQDDIIIRYGTKVGTSDDIEVIA